jgi:hypothetical protein
VDVAVGGGDRGLGAEAVEAAALVGVGDGAAAGAGLALVEGAAEVGLAVVGERKPTACASWR